MTGKKGSWIGDWNGARKHSPPVMLLLFLWERQSQERLRFYGPRS